MSWLQYKVDDGFIVGIFDNKREVKFDYDDLYEISKHRWYIDAEGYPSTDLDGVPVRMHKLILPSVQSGMVIDHKNRNKLDNRKLNLKICTQAENTHNSSLRSTNTSDANGVFFDKRSRKWRAQITREKKTKHIGVYDDYEDAVKARKQAEEDYKKYGW